MVVFSSRDDCLTRLIFKHFEYLFIIVNVKEDTCIMKRAHYKVLRHSRGTVLLLQKVVLLTESSEGIQAQLCGSSANFNTISTKSVKYITL